MALGFGLQATADAFTHAHERMRADPVIQFDFSPPELPPTPSPEWVKALGEFFSPLSLAFKVLFWGAVIVGAAWLIFIVVRAIIMAPRRTRTAPLDQKADQDWRPEIAPARQLLQEADALAAAGYFGEAAHLLLIRSIEDIEMRRPRFVRPALTSRDIAASQALPAEARGTFASIARVVENHLFAEKYVGSDAWQVARSAYSTFAFSETWA